MLSQIIDAVVIMDLPVFRQLIRRSKTILRDDQRQTVSVPVIVQNDAETDRVDLGTVLTGLEIRIFLDLPVSVHIVVHFIHALDLHAFGMFLVRRQITCGQRTIIIQGNEIHLG